MGKNKDEKLNIIKFIPLIIMLGLIIFFAINYRDLSIENILNFTPSNYILTILIIMLIYFLKSITIIIPLGIIYISVANIFPSILAILINILGLAVCMTTPYLIGRCSGTDILKKLASRYPKIKKISQIEGDSEWFLTFIIKMIGIIPNEVSSLVLGSMNIKYKTYITASVLAKVPIMIATTILGANISKPGTPEFKWSIVISIIIFIIVGVLSKKNKKKLKL